MNKANVTNNLVADIRDLWSQLEESSRVDPVEPRFEMEFFFQAAMADAQLRLAALRLLDGSAHFKNEVKELTKEVELCRLIGDLMFNSDRSQPSQPV